jgi:hypothetical protein
VAVLRVALKSSPLTRAIKTIDKGQVGRSYFTQHAEKTLMRSLIFGYHYELLPLNGLRILNGSHFNGIDYSDIHPNRAFMKAQLLGSKRILFNKPLLDVLGIKYIFADLNEPVPPGLVRFTLLPGEKGQILVMYVNPGAWPDAVVVNPESKFLKSSAESRSNDINLIFYDFKPLEAMRITEDSVTIKRDHGSINLMLAPSNKSRTVMLSEYFRPGWKARWKSSAGMVDTEVFPIFGHLIGIEVPKGAVEVDLCYMPFKKAVFLFLSLGTFVALVFLAIVTGIVLLNKQKLTDRRHRK